MKKYALSISLILIAVIATAAGCGSATPVVKRVDHVAVSSEAPEELFNTLSGPLGLPVAWPYTEYPGYSTGGVQAGNVNIEALHFGEPAQTSTPGAMLFGIVLEPYPLEESVPELKERGAEPGKEEPQTMEVNGEKVTLWTNVTLKALCGPEYTVYLCEYSPEAKKRLEGNKATGPLGPLGIMSVEKIIITSKNPKELQDEWSKAMAPDKMSSDGTMNIGTGPAIEVTEGEKEEISSLVFNVKSLSEAKSALEKAGLLGKDSGSSLTIDPSKVQGLDLVFVQE